MVEPQIITPKSLLITIIGGIVIIGAILYFGPLLSHEAEKSLKKEIDANGYRLEGIITKISPGHKSWMDVRVAYQYKGKDYNEEYSMSESWTDKREVGNSVTIVIDTLNSEEFYIVDEP